MTAPLYTAVDGETATVEKLYGSKDSKAVLLYDSSEGGKKEDYGTLYYYESQEDMDAQERKRVKLVSAKDYFALAHASDEMGMRMEEWSATVGEEKITVYSGAEWGVDNFPVICGYEFGTVDYIPNGFLASTYCIDMELVIPNTIKSLGWGLFQESSYNQPLTLPDSIEEIENGADRWESGTNYKFLYRCQKFNSPLSMSDRLWATFLASDDFLREMSAFNQPIVVPDVATTIGRRFLYYSNSFNQPIDLNNITTIGGEFLADCRSFNQPIDLKNVTTIGESFLINTEGFDQDITIPSTIQSVGYGFMRGPSGNMANHVITVECPAEVFAENDEGTLAAWEASSPTYALGIQIDGAYADEFIAHFPDENGPFYRYLYKAGSTPKTTPKLYVVDSEGAEERIVYVSTTEFHALCASADRIYINGYPYYKNLNQYPHITGFDFGDRMPSQIGDFFIFNCEALTHGDFTIPDHVTSIGEYFLGNCSNLNSPVTLNSHQSIGSDFMSNCYAFNQPITVPSDVPSIGGGFLWQCNDMTSVVTIECPAERFGLYGSGNSATLASVYNTSEMFIKGVRIAGPYAEDFLERFPNLAETWFRNLRLVESLPGLKKALNNGTAETEYPIGTEIPDTYGGNDNPLIVGIYGTTLVSSVRKTYVKLLRKYVEPTEMAYNDTACDYDVSAVFDFLQTTYLDNCSDGLKSLITEFPEYYDPIGPLSGGLTKRVLGKWHLSAAQAVGGSGAEDSLWPYWEHAGRVRTGREGTACSWWLRSTPSSAGGRSYVDSKGTISSVYPSASAAHGVLPHCYIIQD